MASGGRSCRESQRARSKLDTLVGTDARFDKIWNGVVWLLLRNPQAGSVIPGKSATFVLITSDFLVIGMPVMEVYYSIVNDELIEVLDIL
jgi:hypothetical protein